MSDDFSNSDFLERSEFDSRCFSPRDGFDVWRDSLAPLFDVRPEKQTALETFTSYTKAYQLRNLAFAESVSTGSVIWRDFRAHGQGVGRDYILVQMVLARHSGDGYAVNGDRGMLPRFGDISIIDLGRAYRAIDHGHHSITLVMARETLLPLLKTHGSPGGLVLSGDSVLGHILGSHLHAVSRCLPEVTAKDAAAVSAGLLGVIANAFGPSARAREEGEHAMTRATLTAICEYIERNLGNPALNGDSLCRTFRCSRSYLYRLFKPHGGVAGYIVERRLLCCYKQITTPENEGERIAEVAYRWGFSDQSHFSRLFRRYFAMSPSEARQLSAGTNSASSDACQAPVYRYWLDAM